jgi:hypothetical protein
MRMTATGISTPGRNKAVMRISGKRAIGGPKNGMNIASAVTIPVTNRYGNPKTTPTESVRTTWAKTRVTWVRRNPPIEPSAGRSAPWRTGSLVR